MRNVSVYEISLGQIAVSALFAIPLAAPSLPHIHFRLPSIVAVVALGALGTGVAYLLYYYVMNTLGAVRAAGVTYVVPITAVFWGALLLHEEVSTSVVAGMLVILAGILLVNLRRTPRREPAASERDSAAASATTSE